MEVGYMKHNITKIKSGYASHVYDNNSIIIIMNNIWSHKNIINRSVFCCRFTLTRIKYLYLAVKVAVDSQSRRVQKTLRISLWCFSNKASWSEA